MSFSDLMNVAGSGMKAQSIRLNTTASNLGNADSVASNEKEAYRARHPVFGVQERAFGDVFNDQFSKASAGVKVLGIVEGNAPLRTEYRPHHPLANEEGYVTVSNVNMMEEMADMLSATQSYKMSVEMMRTGKELMLATLRLGQQ